MNISSNHTPNLRPVHSAFLLFFSFSLSFPQDWHFLCIFSEGSLLKSLDISFYLVASFLNSNFRNVCIINIPQIFPFPSTPFSNKTDRQFFLFKSFNRPQLVFIIFRYFVEDEQNFLGVMFLSPQKIRMLLLPFINTLFSIWKKYICHVESISGIL